MFSELLSTGEDQGADFKVGHGVEVWGLPLNTSNIHRWYAIGKGLARFACFPGPAQPDALFVMPARAPVFTELSCHAAMVDTPHQCAVLLDLFDGWCAHKKRRPVGPLPPVVILEIEV